MTKIADHVTGRPLRNAEIARRLAEVAQMLHAKGENPFKVRAYRRAAETITSLGDSVDEIIRAGGDVTRFPGIGKGIAAALHEIVFSGKMSQLELLLANAPPHIAALNEFPRLDPERVSRVYEKLGISTIAQLKEKFDTGVIASKFGQRMHDHFRQAFIETHQVLLSDADELAVRIRRYLQERCGVTRVEVVGEVRRRVEVISELAFLIEVEHLSAVTAGMEKYGGGIELVESTDTDATFQLPDSIMVTILRAVPGRWGLNLIEGTGSPSHLEELEKRSGALARLAKSKPAYPDEVGAYRAMGLAWIPPELREGNNEVTLAKKGELPDLVRAIDIRGELHAHTTASDGSHTIEQMAAAAKIKGYEYIGITDHSKSLKIAGGVSIEDLWRQIKRIDALNADGLGIRVLKSAEVDILADGSLDYPDDLLAELDYTVCSIHSRFRLNKTEQTERIMRAMDHPAFTILGHATGRLLLKRPGYEFDFDRVIAHAKAARCFFEINASPDRLDLSAENVRLVTAAGIKVAVCTDAHHSRELDYLPCGIDVARRGGVEKRAVLNAMTWAGLRAAIAR